MVSNPIKSAILFILILPTQATKINTTSETNSKVSNLCLDPSCKSCLKTDSNHCMSCFSSKYLIKGNCLTCDEKCLGPSHCTQSGCIKCKQGFYSAEIKSSPGIFKCHKKSSFENINIAALIFISFTFLFCCFLKYFTRVHSSEEDMLYKAADKTSVPSNINIRGKCGLNEYFEEKVWKDFN